jgi:hypothetical protein
VWKSWYLPVLAQSVPKKAVRNLLQVGEAIG